MVASATPTTIAATLSSRRHRSWGVSPSNARSRAPRPRSLCRLAAARRLVVKEPTSRYLAFLAGWGALRVIALVPFLGGIAWLVGTVLGLGTLWVAARAPSGDRTVRVPESPSAEREAV
jgi:hypothetical protein